MQPTPLPWFIVLLTSVPQAFIIIRIGFQLYNLDMGYSRTILLSLISGVLAILARELPLPFGVHTIILIVSSTLLTAIVTGTNPWHCFIAILTGALILGVLEGVLLPIYINITEVTSDRLALKPWLNILYFLPSGIIMAVFYLLAKKRNYVIFDLSLDRD
ncbi:MAG: hypothetical protein VR69_06855 [Peptococcaceae bacterium BRH_c4b]|nr:MAG: hypothetical protein VR69_06855 [Peptococcaceae bacterium BRH_c4b]